MDKFTFLFFGNDINGEMKGYRGTPWKIFLMIDWTEGMISYLGSARSVNLNALSWAEL